MACHDCKKKMPQYIAQTGWGLHCKNCGSYAPIGCKNPKCYIGRFFGRHFTDNAQLPLAEQKDAQEGTSDSPLLSIPKP